VKVRKEKTLMTGEADDSDDGLTLAALDGLPAVDGDHRVAEIIERLSSVDEQSLATESQIAEVEQVARSLAGDGYRHALGQWVIGGSNPQKRPPDSRQLEGKLISLRDYQLALGEARRAIEEELNQARGTVSKELVDRMRHHYVKILRDVHAAATRLLAALDDEEFFAFKLATAGVRPDKTPRAGLPFSADDVRNFENAVRRLFGVDLTNPATDDT
jgi:hypothetical protein